MLEEALFLLLTYGIFVIMALVELKDIELQHFDDDIMITGRVKKGGASCSQD